MAHLSSGNPNDSVRSKPITRAEATDPAAADMLCTGA